MLWSFKDGELVRKGGSENPQGLENSTKGCYEQRVMRKEVPTKVIEGQEREAQAIPSIMSQEDSLEGTSRNPRVSAPVEVQDKETNSITEGQDMRSGDQCNIERERRSEATNVVTVDEGDVGMEEMLQVENEIQERKQVAIQKMNTRIRRQLKPPSRKRTPLGETDGNVRKIETRGKRKTYQEDTEMQEVEGECLNLKRNKMDQSLEIRLEIAEGGRGTSLNGFPSGQ